MPCSLRQTYGRRSRFPSLASIRAFEAAARLGSFAQAAHELETSAASVSYHVRRLEEQIGVALFLRHPHRVDFTESREADRGARRSMLSPRCVPASSRAVDLDETRLSLTTLPTLGTSWLTPKLGRFRARYPEDPVRPRSVGRAQDLSAGHSTPRSAMVTAAGPACGRSKLLPSIFMPLCSPNLQGAAAALADPPRARCR